LHDPELSEANHQARPSHSNQLLRNNHPVTLASFLFTDEKIFTIATPKMHRMTCCCGRVHPLWAAIVGQPRNSIIICRMQLGQATSQL